MGSYRFVEDVTVADVAFEARAESLGDLFAACGKATFDVMVDLEHVKPVETMEVELTNETLEGLLFDWLDELIGRKDTDALVFSEFQVTVEERDAGFTLKAMLRGQPISAELPMRLELGSGNHYLEIQMARPEHVYDEALARALGITIPDQVVVMFHCGSRGFGHQVATDYLRQFLKVMGPKYAIRVPDRELACAPFESPEGRDYGAAMRCGINMSFANRQMICHRIREVFSSVLGRSAEDLGMHMGQARATPQR